MPLTIEEFNDIVAENPVIPSIKSPEGLEHLKDSDCKLVFVLYGDICSIPDIVGQIKAMGKKVLVHIDLIDGLSAKEICVDYLRNFMDADGILSTKSHLIHRAKELGMFAVQRFFMYDSLSYYNILKRADAASPDVIELMPAGMYKIISMLVNEIRTPVIASGLIYEKEDIIKALSAGAQAVSTTYNPLWD